MVKRTRYQNGCLQREKRKAGPDVWTYRWRETAVDGGRVSRKVFLGTVEQYPAVSSARKAAEPFRINVNKETSRLVLVPITFGQLVAHYMEEELLEDSPNATVPKAYSTIVTYRRYLKKWILPRWHDYRLQDIYPVAVEAWPRQMDKSNGTKLKIRNIMSAVFRHGLRYRLLPQNEQGNPMKYVRQSAGTSAVPSVLTTQQIGRLIDNLQDPVRTMAMVAAFTGLRGSELLALKWGDISFDKLEIDVSRAVVYGVVGKCKSKASQKSVPIHPFIAGALLGWRQVTAFNRPEDWVFASIRLSGRKPMNPGMLVRKHLQPAAEKAGIPSKVGWHTFRRTLASLLIANDEDIKVVQELLRHANCKVTLDLYAQADTARKREAQAKLVTRVLPTIWEPEDSSRQCSLVFPCLISNRSGKLLINMVARDGVEPPTPAFSGLRSTT